MERTITYREKDKGIQAIISEKQENGKWKQVKSKQGFKKKGEAKRWAEGVIDDLKEKDKLNQNLDSEMAGTTFRTFSEMFIETKALNSEHNTILAYKTAIKAYSALLDKPMDQITPVDIQKNINERVSNNINPWTIKMQTSFVRVIFEAAVDPYKIIAENPFKAKLQIPKRIATEKLKVLTKAELDDLLSCIQHKDTEYTISLIAGTMGLRIGEIIGLSISDIDSKKSTAKIHRQWKKLKSGGYGFGKVKSKNSIREVPIPKSTLEAINNYLSRKKVVDMNGRIFSEEKSIQSISWRLIKLYRSIGYDISVHTLRHTYATLLIGSGVDFRTAATILGDTPEVVINTYSHTTDDTINKAVEAIKKIF